MSRVWRFRRLPWFGFGKLSARELGEAMALGQSNPTYVVFINNLVITWERRV